MRRKQGCCRTACEPPAHHQSREQQLRVGSFKFPSAGLLQKTRSAEVKTWFACQQIVRAGQPTFELPDSTNKITSILSRRPAVIKIETC